MWVLNIFVILFSFSLLAQEKLVNFGAEPMVVDFVPASISTKSEKIEADGPKFKSGCESKHLNEFNHLQAVWKSSELAYHALVQKHPEIKDWTDKGKLTPDIIEGHKKYRSASEAFEKLNKKIALCHNEYWSDIKIEEEWAVYSAPSDKSERLGALRFLFKPRVWNGNANTLDWELFSSAFEISYVNRVGERKEFHLDFDFFENDNFTGFHTVLAQKGSWFKLPKEPFPHPVWVKIPDRKAKNLHSSTPFNLKTKSFTGDVWLGIVENGMYLGRKYEYGDECKDLPENKIVRVKIPIGELYDKNQHLVGTPLGNVDCDGE